MPIRLNKFAILVGFCGLLIFPLGLAQAQFGGDTGQELIDNLIDTIFASIIQVVQAMWDACWGVIGALFDNVVFSESIGMRVVFIMIILGTTYVLVMRFIYNAR